MGRSVAIDDRCVCEADDGLSSHTDTGLPRRTELTAASNASSRGQARKSRRAGEQASGRRRVSVSAIYHLPSSGYPVCMYVSVSV